jgi:hypothetical protein
MNIINAQEKGYYQSAMNLWVFHRPLKTKLITDEMPKKKDITDRQ